MRQSRQMSEEKKSTWQSLSRELTLNKLHNERCQNKIPKYAQDDL